MQFWKKENVNLQIEVDQKIYLESTNWKCCFDYHNKTKIKQMYVDLQIKVDQQIYVESPNWKCCFELPQQNKNQAIYVDPQIKVDQQIHVYIITSSIKTNKFHFMYIYTSGRLLHSLNAITIFHKISF